MARKKILVVDDEIKMCRNLEVILEEYRVEAALNGVEALNKLRSQDFDLVITDLKMPGMDGLKLLEEIKQVKDIPVILMTAYGTIQTAVEARKKGAEDYILKPFDMEDIKFKVATFLRLQELKMENIYLRRELDEAYRHEMVGESQVMQKIFYLIEKVAPEKSTVLIYGETGTGKELVARAIHSRSPRRKGPFIVVNCAALPETLLESELFGYVRGAFTGAHSDKKGKFQLADGGSIFLDEIGLMDIGLQGKILRVLDQKQFEPIGSTTSVNVDVRIIVATNRDLKKAIEEGTFREDLYFRLSVLPIYLPPLRERREDIPLLVEHFLREYNREMKKDIRGFSPEAMELLQEYHWPGNVRELENVVERAVVLESGPLIGMESLPFHIREERKSSLTHLPYQEAKRKIIHEFEKEYIQSLLQQTGGNVSSAARKAGMDRKNFYLKMKSAGIQHRRFKEVNLPQD